MLAGVIVGKPGAGSPRSAAVWWEIETRWSRFPVVGRGERGAGVAFLEGPPWWEAMFGGVTCIHVPVTVYRSGVQDFLCLV